MNRQHNVDAQIITSTDGGITWKNGTAPHSLTGRFTSPAFLQYGAGNTESPDGKVYMYFPSAADGKSYWCK